MPSSPVTTEFVASMIAVWAGALGTQVSETADLIRDLHASSLQILELLNCVADEFDVNVSVEQLFEHSTPRALADLMAAQ